MKLLHVCEVCGKTEILDSEEAYAQGWDYPPKMGAFGIVSPRTCGECGIMDTLWAAFAIEKKTVDELDEKQLETLYRILGEPESIRVPEPEKPQPLMTRTELKEGKQRRARP